MPPGAGSSFRISGSIPARTADSRDPREVWNAIIHGSGPPAQMVFDRRRVARRSSRRRRGFPAAPPAPLVHDVQGVELVIIVLIEPRTNHVEQTQPRAP